jgi:hypothetical protein
MPGRRSGAFQPHFFHNVKEFAGCGGVDWLEHVTDEEYLAGSVDEVKPQ